MMDKVTPLILEWAFWLRVVAGCMLWYGVAYALARFFLNSGDEPLQAAKKGAFWAMPVSVLTVMTGAWFWWANPLLALLLGLTTFIIPFTLMIALVQSEPRVESG